MSISGPLYRRTRRLFNRNKPGDWTLVWCELSLETGEFLIFQEQNGRRLALIPVRESDIAHVRTDGRDCMEIKIKKSKKETLSSHESSYDVDWWMNTLLSMKKDLDCGIVPRISIVCKPTSQPENRQKAVRRQHSLGSNAGNSSSTNSLAAINTTDTSTTISPIPPTSPPSSTSAQRTTLHRRQPTLNCDFTRFERFTVYETDSKYYVVCSDRHYSRFRMFSLDRTIERPESLAEILEEDLEIYTWERMEAMLQSLSEKAKSKEGQQSSSKFVRSFTAVAIVGCIRFLKGYYFIFVTQRRKIGCIGGNFIYGIQATQQISISQPDKDVSVWSWVNRWLNPSPEDEAEASYSYDITHTLQHNMTTDKVEPAEMFTWNHYLTKELKECLTPGAAADLMIPIVLGSYEQRKCSVFGRLISIILLARRSRHFAGTRYLKRGVADTGKAANDVETEQIIEDENMGVGKFSSFVQYRGSIPVFWSQETSATLPKPPIVLNRVDPTYTATRKHFGDLFERYGSPIVALNLVKHTEKKEREVIVGTEYMNAVEYLNNFMPPEHRIRYVALDYSRLSKQKGLNVLHSLDKFAVWALTQTGFFCSAPKRQITRKNPLKKKSPALMSTASTFDAFSTTGSRSHLSSPFTSNALTTGRSSLSIVEAAYEKEEQCSSIIPPISPTIPRYSRDWLEQKGVLRTNCIDCLDRTNVSQFSVGMRALGQQLYAMGIRNTPLLESRSQLVRVLMLLYSLVGDAISMQYGGSEAHKNVKNSAGGKENVKHRELLTSIRRYYSNSFTDMAKQDAINIFLGHFVPKDGEPPLWELESDYYLHNFEVKNNATKLKIPPAPPSAPVPSLLDIATVNVNSAPTSSNSMVAVLTQSLPVPPSSTASTKAEKLVSKQKREDREAYLREFKRQLEEWWKEPLDAHNLPKYLYKENQSFGSNSERRRTSKAGDTSEVAGDGLTRSICSTMSDGFLQMYHPEELTSFDKALSYKFMSPMDLSNEVHDTASTSSSVTTTGRSNQTSRHTSTTSVRSTSSRKMEDFGDSQPTSRTVRSMSLPDISEEMERPVHRRTRETSSRDTKAEDFTTRGSIVQSPRNYKNVSAVAAEALKRHEEPLSIEDYASNRGIGISSTTNRKYVGDCLPQQPDPVYERYVGWHHSPGLWEQDNDSVKSYFEAYLRDNNVSVNDVRSIREAQARGGATFKIQSGTYAGLDQDVKACVLISKRLKTDPEDRRIYEDSLNYKKQISTKKDSIASDSLELYKSFFDEPLPDVDLYCGGNGNTTSNTIGSSSSTFGSSFNVKNSQISAAALQLSEDFRKVSLYKKKNGIFSGNLISVGPLFKLDGGKDQDFILFNESAAENAFGEVIQNETELSFYAK